MAINATNYDGTKDYKIAEINDLYRPNMLINGDFSHWRRGDTMTKNVEGTFYGADMWKTTCAIGTVMQRLDRGMLYKPTAGKNGWLGQYAQDIEEGATYTLVVKVKANKSTHFTIQLNSLSKTINVGTSYAIYTLTGALTKNAKDLYPIVICGRLEGDEWDGTDQITIEYADLFEGDIAYPHVRENESLALTRCQRWISKIRITEKAPYTGGVYFSGDNAPVVMAEDPTVVRKEFTKNGNDITSDVASITADAYGVIDIKFSKQYDFVRGFVWLSCEPLG